MVERLVVSRFEMTFGNRRPNTATPQSLKNSAKPRSQQIRNPPRMTHFIT